MKAFLLAIVVVLARFAVVNTQDFLIADVKISEQEKFNNAYRQLEESMNVLGMNSDQFKRTYIAKQLQTALTPIFTVPFVISLLGNCILLVLCAVLLILVLKLGGQERKKSGVK